MAVIMRIRRYGIVIAAFVGLAVVGFLLQDAISSNSSVLQPGANNVGKINGETIGIQDFEKKVQEATDNYRLSTGEMTLDDQTLWSIRDQTWTQYVNDILMGRKYEKLGIKVTADELVEQIQGNNPHPAVVQSFTDPNTGRFDPSQVSMFLQQMDQDQTGETRTRWLNFEKFLKEDRLRTKYNTLVKKSMYAPTWQAEQNFNFTNTSVDFDFVYLPFSDIEDASIEVKENELTAYLNNNKIKYEQEESRAIEYISFNILPSKEDTVRLRERLNGLIENFSASKNDTSFLKLYSDEPYNTKYWTKDELKSSIADTFFTIEPGTVIGPYLEDDRWIVAKLNDRKLIADSVKARHIFFSIASAQSQDDVNFKRQQADSLANLLKEKQGNFNSLVLEYSDDNATKFNNGEWGWIKPGEKFTDIDYALFYKYGKGDIFMVPTDEPGGAGFHIIEITEAKPTKTGVQVAFMTKEIVASVETERAIFAEAGKFAAGHRAAKAFREAGDKYSIIQAEGIKSNDNTISGLGASRDVVKWAYNVSPNEVSDVFSLDDKYIVALLASIKKEGLTPLAEVRAEIEAEVKKEKKAELLKAKLKDQSDLNAIASSSGATIQSAAGMTLTNNFIDGVGQESGVVAKAIMLNEGELSQPVTGKNGVFVIKVTAKNEPAKLTDLRAQQRNLHTAAESRVDFSLNEAIRNSADIKDERYKFY